MVHRKSIAAAFAAGALVVASAAVVLGIAPTYELSAQKVANPPNVPVGGADVTFTFSVTATGTGSFASIIVSDELFGCNLAGPVVDAGDDGVLSSGETWDYTCTLNVGPGTTNVAHAYGCHSAGASCGHVDHDASADGEVSVGEGALPSEAPSEAPSESPSEPPASTVPSGDVADLTTAPDATQPSTDTVGGGTPRPHDTGWMLMIALGLLLASVAVAAPRSPSARR